MEAIKTSTTYWIGRPEVFNSGRFGKRVTTYTTAIINENGEVAYRTQSYSSLGKLGVPDNVVKITKSEFEKFIKKSF